MSNWLVWLSLSVTALLFALVAFLLIRALARQRSHGAKKEPEKSSFVPITSDKTMVISRKEIDEMIKKESI